MTLPRVHHREALVRKAALELSSQFLELTKELTHGETLRVLAEFVSSDLGSIAKYAIREERHGNVDKPGGVE